MDRRNFLKFAALTAAGFFLHNETASAYILDTWEPPIRKLFLEFTEYEERASTERIVINSPRGLSRRRQRFFRRRNSQVSPRRQRLGGHWLSLRHSQGRHD